jgi:hypothetical protein
MATERQIAANRANAKRSTGPKSQMGRLKSSRNALRHGLSRSHEPTDLPSVETIVQALGQTASNHEAGRELAQAKIRIWHVRKVRWMMMAALDIRSCSPKDLNRLMSLDRYERIARGRFKLSSRQIDFEKAT